jgi:23S rRNA (uracil1939-C5)-methyltransferase
VITGKRGEGYAGSALEIVSPSADRTEAPCPHFGPCGGCALQHWRDSAYAAWKADLLTNALRRIGSNAVAAPLARTPPGGRRRADFAIRRDSGTVRVGFNAARTHDVVDVRSCPVLAPALAALIAPLRSVLQGISGLRREGSAIINLLDSGPDVLLRGEAPLTTADRTALTAFAERFGIPRISWATGRQPETACQLRAAATAISGVTVSPAPGAFLQASAEGEAAIVAAVVASVPAGLTRRARIADLYSGVGTLTFPLALHARVDAFEADASAVASLRQACNSSGLAGRITAVARDLARQPLSAKELAPYAAVVLDPPYAGAAAQTRELAAGKVATIIYVSCNPAALARDGEMLAEAGYRIESATPIDQFLWSARLESVVVFRK